MSILSPIFELFLLSQSLVRLYQIIPASVDLFFLALEFGPIHFIRVILLAQTAVSFSDLFRVELAVIIDVKQLVRVPFACE